PAQYGVTLTVTDNSGATGIVRVLVPGNTAPVASFTVACSGPTCTFDASSSSDPDGTIASYFWYFGDGSISGRATVSHTYATGTQSQTVSVGVNVPPTASFTSACSGLTCSFDASGSSDSDGRILRYAWDFGDATTFISGSVPPTTSRTYAASGTYTVTLTVTD